MDVLKHIFPKQELVTLNTAYRSTKQITEFCNQIIGKEDIVPYAREGKKPTVTESHTKEELTKELIDTLKKIDYTKYENIAILADDEETAGELYVALSETMDVSYISENSAVYRGGIVVVPKFFAKGMEFDVACVINQKKRKDDIVAQHEYYISCTRALHELHVFEIR